MTLANGEVVITRGTRVVSIDPSDDTDPPSEMETCESLVAEWDAAASCYNWYAGSLRTFDQTKRAVTSAAEQKALAESAPVFVRKGMSYKMYSVAISEPVGSVRRERSTSPVNVGASSPEAPTDGHSPYERSESPSTNAGTTATRSRDKYTKAVAFEFVNGVMSNVLGHEFVGM